MSEHPREHEERLERFLAGELGADDPALRAQLEGCAACREELERLRTLDVELREVTRQALRDVADARAGEGPADEALVRRSLEHALANELSRGARRRRTLFLWGALAAGLLLGLGFWLFRARSGDGSPRPEILLHGGAVRCERPLGVVDDYDDFTWSAVLPPGGHYELRIHALVDDRPGERLLTIPCETPSWTPAAGETRALPDAIWWSVVVLDVMDVRGDEGWAEASRRAPLR